MELGNMLFGNSRGEYPVERNSDWVEALQRLFDAATPNGSGDYHGVRFENNTFRLEPYYWDADCTPPCDYDQRAAKWDKEHAHKPTCFHIRYDAESDSYSGNYKEQHEHMTEWSKKNGYPDAPNGMAVHCDCGYQDEWQAWSAINEHDDRCRVELPNFHHKPSGYKLSWYKYPLRDSYANRTLNTDEFLKMIDECFASIGTKGNTK